MNDFKIGFAFNRTKKGIVKDESKKKENNYGEREDETEPNRYAISFRLSVWE